jgi:hypothetical protein
LQAVAVRILADGEEDLAHGGLDAWQVDRATDVCPAADQPGRDKIELAPIDRADGREFVVSVWLSGAAVAQLEPSVLSLPAPNRTGSLSPIDTGLVTSAPLGASSPAAGRRRRQAGH